MRQSRSSPVRPAVFSRKIPAAEEGDFKSFINPDSLQVIPEAYMRAECCWMRSQATVFQFLRMGYFCADTDSNAGKPVFNRTVTLKDTWAKEAKKS